MSVCKNSPIALLHKLGNKLLTEGSTHQIQDVFGPLLVLNERQHSDSDVNKLVRQELALVQANFGDEILEPLEKLDADNSPIASSLLAIILSVRPTDEEILLLRESSSHQDEYQSWWKPGDDDTKPLSQECIDILSHVHHAAHRIVFTEPVRQSKREREEAILKKSLVEIREGVFGDAYNQSEFAIAMLEVTTEVQRLADMDKVRLSNLSSEILHACSDILLELKCQLLNKREKIQSLVCISREASPLQQRIRLIRNVVNLINDASVASPVLLQQLYDLNTRYYGTELADLTGRIFEVALHHFRTASFAFINDTRLDHITDFIEVRPTQISSCLDFPTRIDVFDFPQFLGGPKSSRQFSLYKTMFEHGWVERKAQLHLSQDKFWVEELLEQLDTTAFSEFRQRLLYELQKWHDLLVLGLTDAHELEKGEVYPVKLLSQNFENLLKTCAALIREATKSSLSSRHQFEMHVLIVEIEAHFKQSVDFDIWPELVKRVNIARNLDEISLALDECQMRLEETFLLREDIHFLAMDGLIRAVETGNIARFRRSRAFLLKCLRNSVDGPKFLARIDHNGFYHSISM